MTHHARLNIIMLVTIVGLLVFVYFKPQTENVREYTIAAQSARAIHTVRIVRQQREIVLHQQDNHWYLTEPVHIRANEKKIKDILKILTANSNYRFPLKDLARYSLDPPHIQLHFDNEYMGLGGYAPITNQQYVLTNGYVYLISPHYALAVPVNAGNLINSQVLAHDEIPVKLELNHLIVELSNGNWSSIDRDSKNALDAETLRDWVHLWQTAVASEVTLEQEQKLSDDLVEVNAMTISLQSEQKINLKILQNENEVVFLRAEDGIGYHFPIDVGNRLLDPYTSKLQ